MAGTFTSQCHNQAEKSKANRFCHLLIVLLYKGVWFLITFSSPKPESDCCQIQHRHPIPSWQFFVHHAINNYPIAANARERSQINSNHPSSNHNHPSTILTTNPYQTLGRADVHFHKRLRRRMLAFRRW
jgi:hypothetical protein